MTNLGNELQANSNYYTYGNYRMSNDIIYNSYYDYKDQKNEEVEALLNTLNDIEQIQKNMLMALAEQNIELDRIDDNITNSNETLELALNDLEDAYNMQFRYIPVILGCSVGLATFGPLALIPTFKVGGLLVGIGAGSIGGFFGYKYQ